MTRDHSRRHDMRVRRLPLLLLQAAIALASPASFAAVLCDAYATATPALSLPGSTRRPALAVPRGNSHRHGDSRHASPRSWLCWSGIPRHSTDADRRAVSAGTGTACMASLPAAQIDIDVPSAATEGAPVSQGSVTRSWCCRTACSLGSAFTYLGDHLASRGYVVVAIDHRDDLPGPLDPLKSALAFGRPISLRPSRP